MEDGLQVVPEDAVQLRLDMVSDPLPCFRTRFLAELPRNGDATVRALAEKLSELLLELPSSRLLPAVCVALLELGGRPPGAERLRKGLRQLVAEGPAETPALVYALAALHEGRLPFALVGYAWALAARCETASEEERLKLWTFALAARHLSSASAWTSLRLAPNAAALEGLHHLEARPVEGLSGRGRMGGPWPSPWRPPRPRRCSCASCRWPCRQHSLRNWWSRGSRRPDT